VGVGVGDVAALTVDVVSIGAVVDRRASDLRRVSAVIFVTVP